MKILIAIISVLIVLSCSQKNPEIELTTALGKISIELYAKKAQITTTNFLEYVDGQLFNGAHFYRIVNSENQPDDSIRIAVIQGGLGWDENPQRQPAIVHESTQETGVLHLDGVISMARGEPGTADAEFFICVGDQPDLDFGGMRNPDGLGFAAFGRVTAGMDVVKKIHQLPNEQQMLTEKVAILSIKRK
ncbi:MAG: peptidylprolyl isomerase [Calditrichaeota bacterium]|nr:MAG: peptidylprolyl isomerase [Calditrichota bacterium]